MREEILTFCPICLGHCSAKATVEDGKIVKWERETESGFPSEPCRVFKGQANMEIPVHPERLKYPLKRAGAKGEGKWQRVSWDEALDGIAAKLTELKQKYGPECVAVALGEPKGLEFAIGQRFASAFGTPNVASPHHLCGAPRVASSIITYGEGHHADPYPDEHRLPRLMVIWGAQLDQTRGSIEREWLRATLLNGAKLVVVDPKKIDLAGRADLWIKPKPGSDGALVMGLIKVIIDEKLYDEAFVAKWTVGFDKLIQELQTFTLDDVEKATWVPRQQIEYFARLYVQLSPAVIYGAGGIWSHGVRSFQSNRALAILRIITGAQNIPEWGVDITPGAYNRPGRFFLISKFPRKAEKTVGNNFKYAMRSAFIPGQALSKAILREKPYPIKAGIFILTNPLVSYPDARETYEALMKLELMVVNEIFMTPTAAIADFVLPAATSGEYDAVGYWGAEGALRAFPKLVDPPGEAWPDVKIINELAKKLGMGENFWDDYRKTIDFMIEPSGLTWEQFKKVRMLAPTREYKGEKDITLNTPSGKIEIYSERAREIFACDPLPTWKFLSQPIFDTSAEYPLLLTSGVDEAFKLTSFKHLAYMRQYKPQPTVALHPETARKAGLKEGEWVTIESKRGRIVQQLVLDPDLDPRVAFGSFGWWFPEDPANLLQWDKSNINILLESEPSEIATGSMELRGIPCRVYQA